MRRKSLIDALRAAPGQLPVSCEEAGKYTFAPQRPDRAPSAWRLRRLPAGAPAQGVTARRTSATAAGKSRMTSAAST
jgi:hypothetical protein